MQAAPAGWPAGVDRVILDEIDSTSEEAARRAPVGPTWIMARRQTGARGRRGRAWSMPEGNFAASLSWRPDGDPAALALRSFVASLALHDTLAGMGVAGLSLKWPNDVLLDGRKLAGILLESPRPGLLVLGIGVNLVAGPDPSALEPGALAPISLRDASGLRIEPEAFLDALAPAVAARETQFTTLGFAPIRSAWLAHAARLGETITARTMTDATSGTFEDVDAEGHLVLGTPDGPVRITAGDVFFGEPPCS
ncbi:biotin--[acetyl-CoA-carboxylase] ligase [Jannaschia sp. KMU-145]|uniref:biotin--[acetyl-CoA-carboxylase] ligase n=1 Tax=Jannaschia halovivens TaxID=3388667 RepID=UPI00396B3E86